MNARRILTSGRGFHAVEPDIFSALPYASERPQRHDAFVRAYDLLFGSHLYNRLSWANATRNYATFARDAVRTAGEDELYLDIGCGSLLFRARAYASTLRPIVLVDLSRRRLRRARFRLLRVSGKIPENILLMQADPLDLPFEAGHFGTVFSMGALHRAPDSVAMLSRLLDLLSDQGELHLASLVLNRRSGDRLLRLLFQTGEVGALHEGDELPGLVETCGGRVADFAVRGNVAYAVAQHAAASLEHPPSHLERREWRRSA